MFQKIQQLSKRTAALAVVSVVVLGFGSLGIVKAQSDRQDHGWLPQINHQSEPVWEEINRDIKLNPENPAPPDVVAELVSLKVTYKDFRGRQRTGIVEVNRALKDDVITFFKYAYYLNFPINEVAVSSDRRFKWDDNKLMDANITSCFNYRTIAGTTTPSLHGSGRACDINPRQNPYITLDEEGNPAVQPKGASWNLGADGTLHGDHALIQLMESRGWTWGGRWTLQDLDGAVIDYQHLQKRD